MLSFYAVSIVDVVNGVVVHQQPAPNLGVVDRLIRDFRTDRVLKIREGYWELTNSNKTRKMLVTWQN